MAVDEQDLPLKSGGGCMKWVGWGAAGFVTLAVLGALMGGDDKTGEAAKTATETAAPAKPEAMAVTANELFNAYQANEVAAKAQYGDKPLLVSGTVDGVTLDLFDKPVVQLQTPNQFMSVQASGVDAAAAGALSKGQKVTLLCGGVGEVIGTPMLDDCVLQK